MQRETAGEHSAPRHHPGGEDRRVGKQKPPSEGLVRVLHKDHASRSSSREGVFVKAIEAGLLTDGSSYSPTPSQRCPRQWLVLLAFVPDHSGASVRELHPLPSSFTSIATISPIIQEVTFSTTDVKKISCLPSGANTLHPRGEHVPLMMTEPSERMDRSISAMRTPAITVGRP